MGRPACGLCREEHEVKGECPARKARDAQAPILVEVERQAPWKWDTDHGARCVCMACVLARSSRRDARGGRYPTTVSA